MRSFTKGCLFIALIVFFGACSSNEIGDSKDVNQDKIYQSYAVSYSEGSENAEVYCQFRFAGSNGTTLVLNNPSNITFDGVKIAVDSSKYGGAYYRAYQPAKDLYKKHTLVFTTAADKKLTNSFSFDHFKLVNVPAAISKKQAFNLNFETTPLQANDRIEVSAGNTDSSFTVIHDVNEKGTAVIIPVEELKRQKGKQLSLTATLYRSLPLQQGTAEGGKITVRYSLNPVKVKLTE